MIITSTRKFDKKIKKQSKKVQAEFINRIKLFINDINNPILNTHKLSGKLQDLWSFNLSGDVRVVFDKSYKDTIILIDIGSHSELYS
jgi:addiction module RelE/StbE family toxin